MHDTQLDIRYILRAVPDASNATLMPIVKLQKAAPGAKH